MLRYQSPLNLELCPLCLKVPSPEGLACPACRGILPYRTTIQRRIWLNAPGLEPLLAVAAYHYHSPIPQVIRNYKFHEQLHYLRFMSESVATAYLRYRTDVQIGRLELLAEDILNPDVVAAVPLHPRRKQERGYDQAQLLGEGVAAKLGLPFETRGLFRIKATRRQSEMRGREGRFRNVREAFAVNPGYWQSKTVLLIDDVATTGASLQACSEVILDAGAYGVLGLALASDRRGRDDEHGLIMS